MIFKSDSIVIAPSATGTSLKIIIIDFGKACEIHLGKCYHLSSKERDHYRLHHPLVAPDLRDGLCKQSEISDIFSFGRIADIVFFMSTDEQLNDTVKQCMMYSSASRPSLSSIKRRLL